MVKKKKTTTKAKSTTKVNGKETTDKKKTVKRRGRRRVNFTYQELWKENKIQKFRAGNVVRNGKDGSGNIGVVIRPQKEIGIYDVKWHTGIPNPWDYVLGLGYEDSMVVTDEPNPLSYSLHEKYPGPSSEAIMRFEEKSRINKQNKERTGKDVDAEISVLEEEYKKRKNIKTEEEVDIIAPVGLLEDDDSMNRDIIEYENEVLYDKIKRNLDDEENI